MRGSDDRSVPVEAIAAVGLQANARRGAYRFLLAGAKIGSHNTAALRLGKKNVRVVGIGERIETVAAANDAPVGICNALRVARAAGAGPGGVVLLAAGQVIERLPPIGMNLVILTERNVVVIAPPRALIERTRHAAISAEPEVGGVCRINPEGVHVGMDIV